MLGSKSDETSHTVLTFQLLEDTLYGTGASAAGHSHIELVLVVRHGGKLVGAGCWKKRRDTWRGITSVDWVSFRYTKKERNVP